MTQRRELSFERETNKPCHNRNGALFGRVYYRTGGSVHPPIEVDLGRVVPDITLSHALLRLVHKRLVAQYPRRQASQIDERQIVGIGLARLCYSAKHDTPSRIRDRTFRLEGAGGLLVAANGKQPFEIQPLRTRVARAVGAAGIDRLPLPSADDLSVGPAIFLSPVLLPSDTPITHGIELHSDGRPIYGAVSEGVQIVHANELWSAVPGHPSS